MSPSFPDPDGTCVPLAVENPFDLPPIPLAVSRMDLEGFLARLNQVGLPIFMADPLSIMESGRRVEFEDGTLGVLVREVGREERS